MDANSTTSRFAEAVHAARSGDQSTLRHVMGCLAAEPAVPGVAAEVAGVLELWMARLWRRGWQPVDVVRWVDRRLGRLESLALRRVMAAEAAGYEDLGTRVAPEWMSQLARVDARCTWKPGTPWLAELDDSWPDVLWAALRLTDVLMSLPGLPVLTDPPSEWREGLGVRRGSLPRGVLDKVRALLAKAESTSFDAEAEAFTAKAQELMARHRIDRALLDAGDPAHAGEAVGRRIGIDDPYADAKAALVAGVADANGSRAVWARDLGFTTVFGFADELDAVEELFTSLLVQATAALRRAGSKQDRFGRSRTTRFRRSFLAAFAVRIGQRLRETVDATVEAASAELGIALVPVLAVRAGAATTAAKAAFPDADTFSLAATDGEGWHAGTIFGDQADLCVGPRLSRAAT
jgi:hypothetical protein